MVDLFDGGLYLGLTMDGDHLGNVATDALTNPDDGEVIELAIPALERNFTHSKSAWVVPSGGNWLAAWGWANKLQRLTGVSAQRAMRTIKYRYPFE